MRSPIPVRVDFTDWEGRSLIGRTIDWTNQKQRTEVLSEMEAILLMGGAFKAEATDDYAESDP